MKELKFASQEEALQHLSDVTGKKIVVAAMPMMKSSGSEKCDAFIGEDNDEVKIEFDYEGEDKEVGQPAYIDITSVIRDGNEILETLTEEDIEGLRERAGEYLDEKFQGLKDERGDMLYDRMKDEGF